MNMHRKNLSIYLLAATLSGTSLVACAQTAQPTSSTATASDAASKTLLQPMQQMMEKLKKLQATGDPDFDYAFQAKIHAQGAQDLLKQEVQNGKDSALKQMAQSLLTANQTDITTIDNTLRQLKPSRPNQAFTQQQGRNIQAMTLKMQQGGTADKFTNNFDKNFATLLLDHRQDAIDMANTYLQYGKNETLRNYAQQLVTKAQEQMTQLKAMPK